MAARISILCKYFKEITVIQKRNKNLYSFIHIWPYQFLMNYNSYFIYYKCKMLMSMSSIIYKNSMKKKNNFLININSWLNFAIFLRINLYVIVEIYNFPIIWKMKKNKITSTEFFLKISGLKHKSFPIKWISFQKYFSFM